MSKFRSALVLTPVLVFAVLAIGACGADDDDDGGGSETASASPLEPSIYCGPECQQALELKVDPESVDCTVGLSWNSADHPYGATTIERSEEAAGAFPNMELIVGDGRNNANTQTSQVEDMIAQGIDVLIISPADAAALGPVAERAAGDGIDVIASDREVDAPVTTYIGSDNVEAGTVAGEHIVELLGGEGSVVELQGTLGASPTIDRHTGFEEALAGSDVEIIASPTANYDRAEGLQVMQDMLQRFDSGEIDAVFTHNDEMSLGAIQAIREAGREDEIAVVGIDGQESALEAIEAGEYAASVVYPIPVPEHILAAAKLCSGESVPERIKQDSTLVTPDNVEEYKGTTF